MRNRPAVVLAGALALAAVACGREGRGPLLAGGHEVKSWVEALKDADPKKRRVAVLKLGNVGDADSAAAEGLAGALLDPDAQVRRRRRARRGEAQGPGRGDPVPTPGDGRGRPRPARERPGEEGRREVRGGA